MKRDKETVLVAAIYTNAGFTVRTVRDETCQVPLLLHYRNNPDGTIRWLWPAGARQAHCLRFYTAAGWKAKALSWLLTQVFRAGLESLTAQGTVTLFAGAGTLQQLNDQWGNDYALFTGTTGPNRKALVWHHGQGQPVFIKVALSVQSQKLIAQERVTLQAVQQLACKQVQLPAIADARVSAITLSDIRPTGGRRLKTFEAVHAQALTELYARSEVRVTVGQLSQWNESREKLQALQASGDERLPKGLIRKLSYLLNAIDENDTIPAGMAHGDFTSWNMYCGKDRVYVYDWELAQRQAPVLWDAFHFIFQSGILIHHYSTKQLFNEVNRLRQQTWWQTTTVQAAHFEKSLELYLLMNTIYYVHLYAGQEQWHLQVAWLLTAWNEALSLLLVERKLLTARQVVVMDIFDFLQDKTYVALKWLTDVPDNLPVSSDIDLCAGKKEQKALLRYVDGHPLVLQATVRRSSFMHNAGITLRDGTMLSLDILTGLKWRKLTMLPATRMLQQHRNTPAGVRVPVPCMDFTYTWLFYLLNGASVPQKYRQHFLSLNSEDEHTLNNYFLSQWQGTGLLSFSHAFDRNKNLQQVVTRQVQQQSFNRGWQYVINTINYIADTCRSFFQRSGIVITFSGVDGAGKSTVIETTRQVLEKNLRKRIIVIRHRPSLLPILSAWTHGKQQAEANATARLPRQGTNGSRFSSLLRFGYYYMDYLFGQFFVQLWYVKRGYIVLYDRYYFDFINDGLRSNIRLSPTFTRWFYRFLLKPRLNFFLYASPQEILKRKQELDATAIARLTEDYLQLFAELDTRSHRSRYLAVYNQQLDHTVNLVIDHVKKMIT